MEETRENGDSEVWVDFDWTGPEERNFYHPFLTMAVAAAAVRDGGVIKVLPELSREPLFLAGTKRLRVEAALGGVRIGARS